MSLKVEKMYRQIPKIHLRTFAFFLIKIKSDENKTNIAELTRDNVDFLYHPNLFHLNYLTPAIFSAKMLHDLKQNHAALYVS